MSGTDATAPVVDLSQEASTGLFEIALIAGVVTLAAAYLFPPPAQGQGPSQDVRCP